MKNNPMDFIARYVYSESSVISKKQLEILKNLDGSSIILKGRGYCISTDPAVGNDFGVFTKWKTTKDGKLILKKIKFTEGR